MGIVLQSLEREATKEKTSVGFAESSQVYDENQLCFSDFHSWTDYWSEDEVRTIKSCIAQILISIKSRNCYMYPIISVNKFYELLF